MFPSCPYHSVAVLATTILCASIILPITPPELLAAAIRLAGTPTCSAEILCKLPNRTFDEVSEPVRATPNQPSSVPKKGYSAPVRANANPMVASRPEYRVRKPIAIIAEIVNREKRTRARVLPYALSIAHGVKPIISPEITAATNMPDAVADNQFSEYTAVSAPPAARARPSGATRQSETWDWKVCPA